MNNHDLFTRWYEDKEQLLYETDDVMVFIADIARVRGHLLVVPKKNVTSMVNLERDVFVALWQQVYVCVEKVKEKLGCVGVIVSQNEMLWKAEPNERYHVPWVHVHVMPTPVDFSARLSLSKDDVAQLKEQLQ